ncbi:hypothetical protein ACFYVL_14285 [Streptomyces sp. NPDC004111]|uniref:hypothetical protein n=1 Tax=Streptomyces sp. NPDC004111 TaxID=3364690 RepID=UPI0036D182DB
MPPFTTHTGRGQHLSTDEALAAIVDLSHYLCEHLTDSQWRTADRIRHLAETATRTTNGAS